MRPEPFCSKCLVLALALSLSLPSRGQEPASLSFECKAKVVPKALKLLGDKAGIPLEAGPEYNNVPLILRFSGVTLEEAMAKIAEATLGTWTKTATGHRLAPDREAWKGLASKAALQRQSDLAEAVKSYLESRQGDASWDASKAKDLVEKERQSVEKLLSDLRKNNPELDASRVMVNKGSSRSVTPATPALLDVLSRFSPQALAQVAPGQRVVYSSSPTRVQRPFPFSTAQAVSKFVTAHNLLASAVLTGPPSSGNVRVSGGLDLSARPISTPQLKLLVVFTRPVEDTGLRVELKFADQGGSYVGSATAYLRPKSASTATELTWSPASDEAIPYEAVSKELAAAFVSSAGEASNNRNRIVMRSDDSVFTLGSDSPTPAPPLSASALGILVDPADTDPQATFVSEGLIAAAKSEGQNLAAALPDSVILPLAREAIKEGKTAGFLRTLAASKVTTEKRDGWIVASPMDRLASASDQMDREASSKLYIPVLKRGYARLAELAKFAFSLGETPRLSNFGYTALRLLDPFVAEALQMGLLEQPSLYKFLGTMDPAIFEALRPVNMVVATLTSQQKALLESVAYGSDGFGNVIGEGDFVGVMISDNPNEDLPKGPSLADEPTEAMPNGLAVNGRINLSFRGEPMVKGVVTGQRGGQFFTAGSLGGHLAFLDRPINSEFDMKSVAFDGYLEARGNLVKVNQELVPGRKKESTFSDAWLKPGAMQLAFDALPTDFRAEVAKSKEQMSQNRFHIGGNQKPPR